jgi:hypothetical protein
VKSLPWAPSSRLVLARHARRRFITAGLWSLTLCLLAGVGAFAALAPVAEASVWTGPPGARVFPNTAPGARHSVSLSLACGEYQGFIVGLRGSAARHVSASWVDDPGTETPTDPFIVQNAVLDQVAFVHIKRPTSGTGAKDGLYPDPLLPRGFGTRIAVPAHSSSLYVLLHVPYDSSCSAAGTYAGTLQVTNGTEKVYLSVSLKVWDFGWPRLSTRTAFQVNFNDLGGNLVNDYAMLQEHGVTPLMPRAVPPVTSSGAFKTTTHYLATLRPYLDTDGLDMANARMPWLRWYPDYPWKFEAGSVHLLNYLTNVCRLYKENGWQDKLVSYPVDEPTSVAQERLADRLARTLHKASAKVGFRAKFLLTDDPRPTNLGPMLAANKYLWSDVDIWALRYYYFFGRVPVVRKLQAKGSQIWWYPYCNRNVAHMPNFVIDKSLADERVWGWLMQQWHVDGLLYWGVNRWGNARTGVVGSRDPYKDPISFIWSDGRVCNGEASLIYPGYYPRYGLKNRNAVPVSSLRLEALRDGLADKEYLKLATELAGAKAVAPIIRTITWYPYPIKYGHIFKFPKYVSSASRFAAARAKLAAVIEQKQDAQGAGGQAATGQSTP